ncbi:MAG: EAL domain-containing protein [Pseudomonadota bacterium]
MTDALKQMGQERSGAVYRTLVRTLFGNFQILILSIVGTSFAMALSAYASGAFSIVVVTALLVFTGLVRVVVLSRFYEVDFENGFTDAVARRWENIFTVCATSYALVMGSWVFIACLTNNTFAIAASFAVTFGNLIGVCCRSYPFSRLVRYQLAAVFIPVVLGVELLGGPFMLLGILLVPYVFSIFSFATDLRETQSNNIIQRQLAEYSAKQLDHAINNVPQGIILFDDKARVEVANAAVLQYLRAPMENVRGRPLKDLLSHAVQFGRLDNNDRAILTDWVQNPEAGPFTTAFKMDAGDRRLTLKMQSTPIAGGGLVLTTEDITREVETEKRIEQMTRLDWLTGLLNRNYFGSILEERLGTGEPCCVLIIHLEHFKSINKLLGHQFGDMVLTQVTKRLERVARDNGLLARYSGDQFALALFGRNAKDAARMTADAVVEIMAERFAVEDRKVQLGCKIGLVEAGRDAVSASALLKFGDLALLQARKSESCSIVEFRPELAAEAIRMAELQEDLRRALDHNQMEAWFQPLVALRNRKVSTCEALMRWHHPRHGMVSPAIFIPMAEEMGLVSELGDWMLEQACAACTTWPAHVRVAVNLSPLQFKQGDVVETVRTTLAKTGLAPHRLELEITESLALDDIEGTVAVLNEFKAMGVSISLDDFGTGYSCLSYMNSLPIDKLKIDRAFVLGLERGNKGLPLLQAISAMGRQLKLKLVVEGVEKPEELAVVTRHKLADEMQGYLFSKPLCAADILQALQPDSALSNQLSGSMAKHAIHVA